MPQRDISPRRRGVYYLGMALSGIGMLLFLSVFVSVLFSMRSTQPSFGVVHSQDIDPFTLFARAFGGLLTVAIGQGLMRLGKTGIAGSGIVLSPQQTRRDLEPWARMSGGMLKDALDESGLHLSKMPFDEQLRRLEALKRDNLISDADYTTAKTKILQSLGG